MAVTPSSLKANRPEFQYVDDSRVQNAIDAADEQCDERIFGGTFDLAVELMACHVLATSPGGMQARLVPDDADGATVYLSEWTRMAQRKAAGPWARGQNPAGLDQMT